MPSRKKMNAITFGDLLYNFPQYVMSFMKIVDGSRHATMGCVQCCRDRRNTTVYVPTHSSFGYLFVVSETYPRGGNERKAYCMWYQVPIESSLPTRSFVSEHPDVSFSLRDDAPLVLSIFPGFWDHHGDRICILDSWLYLGYSLTNVPYCQRRAFARKLGLRPVSSSRKTKNHSTWCVLRQFGKYVWVPSETSFNLLVDAKRRVYSNQGDMLTADYWKPVSRAVVASSGDPIINLYVTNCKSGHKIKLLHSRGRDRTIVDVPSLFV